MASHACNEQILETTVGSLALNLHAALMRGKKAGRNCYVEFELRSSGDIYRVLMGPTVDCVESDTREDQYIAARAYAAGFTDGWLVSQEKVS